MADSNTLVLEITHGPVVIEMRPDLAPGHVARIKELVRDGFYDGVVFHRVIDGFMAQTGDPTGTGTGGSGSGSNNYGVDVEGAGTVTAGGSGWMANRSPATVICPPSMAMSGRTELIRDADDVATMRCLNRGGGPGSPAVGARAWYRQLSSSSMFQ